MLINYVDLNGDGELAFEEFVELVHQMRRGGSRNQGRARGGAVVSFALVLLVVLVVVVVVVGVCLGVRYIKF